jgi:hypothetical protein
MKMNISILIVLFTLVMRSGFSQESSKELKEKSKIEKQNNTEVLVNSKEFVFTGKTALPQGARSVDLTTRSNFVKFHPELIECDMPYFGRTYSGAGYGGDTGLRFSGKPEKYTVIKKKKNHQVDAEVKTGNKTYSISLSVGFEGSATLTVISSNQSTISYHGDITSPEPPAEAK